MIPSLRDCLDPYYGNVDGKNPFSPQAAPTHSVEIDFFEAIKSAVLKPSPPLEGIQTPKLLEELELDILKGAVGQDHLYSMSGGTPAGITFAEKNYELVDPYIKDTPVRHKASELMMRNDDALKITWCEKAGVIHLGGQINSFIPVATFPGGSVGPTFGVSADAIVRYRSLQPRFNTKLQHFDAPLTPELALKMPPGSEFEFLGSFAAGVSAGVFVANGLVAGPAMVGAAAFASCGIAGKAELGICVTALDKPEQVRITVRRLGRAESFFAMGITTGLMYQLMKNWTSAIGTNSNVLPNSTTTSNYLNSITQASVATLGGSTASNYANTTLFSLDLDLSQAEAIPIYRHMMTFQFGTVAEEAQKNPHCARLAIATETSSGSMAQAVVKMLGQVLAEETQTHQYATGNIAFPMGDGISYVDSTVGEVQKLWIWGSRDVKWQEVTVEDKTTGERAPYFRFRYADSDKRFTAKRLHRFLRFAQSLGLDQDTLINGKEHRLAALEDTLKKSKKVEINLDLFLSTHGIKKILSASSEEIVKAYLKVSTEISTDYAETPLFGEDKKAQEARALIQLFDERLAKHRFDIFGLSRDINECHARYKKLTGRSLTLDYGLRKQAENFAALILKARCAPCVEESAELLFIELGSKKRFDYQQSISALMRLAGRDGAMIEKLLLESRNIKLEVPSEAALEHPQKKFSDYVNAAASL